MGLVLSYHSALASASSDAMDGWLRPIKMIVSMSLYASTPLKFPKCANAQLFGMRNIGFTPLFGLPTISCGPTTNREPRAASLLIRCWISLIRLFASLPPVMEYLLKREECTWVTWQLRSTGNVWNSVSEKNSLCMSWFKSASMARTGTLRPFSVKRAIDSR